MDTHGQHLAETYLAMLNKHDPDLVDRFVAEEYRNHNAFVADKSLRNHRHALRRRRTRGEPPILDRIFRRST